MRQNNLKGFDIDFPLGKYVAVTGLSGSGKSSLVFETLHAEGQRRYVETFSAYTRQFLDLLDKPDVDSIENVRPSIAIEQTNTVKSSRSTVGTMTELTDFFKVWFSHAAECYDPETGERVEDDNPDSIWRKTLGAGSGAAVLVTFEVPRPGNLAWPEILGSLKNQAYVRVLASPSPGSPLEVRRIEDLLAGADPLAGIASIHVIQDRLTVGAASAGRFKEAAETAMHFGRGEVRVFRADPLEELGHFSRGLHSPKTGRRFRAATPALFSFNSPLGACPACRGFGRVIEIDYRLAIPDASLSIDGGALRCWEGEVYSSSKDDFRKFAKKRGIPTNIPFEKLTPEQRSFVVDGEPGYGEDGKEWPRYWYGIKGFFRWLEKNTYKMHVRVFLSRYRSYNTCPTCRGARLQPEALCWKWGGRTLPELYALPIDALHGLLSAERPARGGRHAELAFDAILTRLRYLREVGLGYLTPDRPSRTLSGGEVERVNLTGCLGSSLVDTLFVMDEPSVGLHPRDVDRLVAILRTLVRAGNSVVVVEHDEAMIRAADQVIEIGPEPGERGGRLVFQGTMAEMLADGASITGAYFSGRRRVEGPGERRPVLPSGPALVFRGADKHNLRGIDVRIPLGRFVCLSGVSGSGKSTLLDNVIHQGLMALRGRATDDPATVSSIDGADLVSEVVLVDQAPVSRTPRSNAALYVDAWDLIRELFAGTDAAREAGMGPSSFSFNSGDGRCDHCQGLGHERVEMQFLSDVYVPCPVCGGRRFKPEVLAIPWRGTSVAEVLAMSVDEATRLFAGEASVVHRLSSLASVGLGYLTLGQPLNTLSGGESQRLKLVRYLGALPGAAGALLLLDEPTTGLHRHDVARLLGVLQALVERGHSLVVIEHNPDVLRAADWILEVGPEAGAAGGRIVAEGTPEDVAAAGVATSPFLYPGPGEASARTLEAAEAPEPAARPTGAIEVVGARENNLKGLSVRIPHRSLTVVTGVSGSGKSTLAFDIIFAEGQRRFMESMSPYARQFVEQLPRPSIERLTGIPPAVAIEQRVTRGSLKSTVATITEVAQYLRLLYARIGVQHHPDTDRAVTPLSLGALKKLLSRVLSGKPARRARHLYLCAPLVRGRKGHHQPMADWIEAQGFELMRTDGKLGRVDAFQKLDRYKEHDIEVVVADLAREPKPGAALQRALQIGKGSCFLALPSGAVLSWFSTTRTDIQTGESFPELDPKDFSFNSARGWCPTCRGYGKVFAWMADEEGTDDDEAAKLRELGLAAEERGEDGALCPDCRGERLNRISRSVKLHLAGRRPPLSLPALLACPPSALMANLGALDLDDRGRRVARDILPQIRERLAFMDHVGLGYLSLDRPTKTLSGGEAQRIRLAAQLGTNLAGVLYVLDEPSIGLHAKDNERLIGTLLALRDKGNTLLVVEHDDELMARADLILDIGPDAGVRGGELVALGTPSEIRAHASSKTGLFLAKGIAHPLRGSYRDLGSITEPWVELRGARLRNLRGVDVRVPPGRLTMVAGPSGAGKSTLFRDILGPAVASAIKARKGRLRGGANAKAGGAPFGELRGGDQFRSVIEVDQSPIGKTPRSTPATYLGIFDLIRKFFASLPEAKIRGYTASRFSFNTVGGRCTSCEGAGRIRLEMAFMPDTYLPCDDCQGLRYGPELLEVAWKGKSVGQVLQLTFEEASAFFAFHSELSEVCKLMADCGLGYLTLGQSSSTLSGGEAQRLKLVTELSKGLASYRERSRGTAPRNLYVLEEPTIGLHLSDCEKLIRVLHALVDQGHTVVVIEHNLDLLLEADYVVELGPGGGPDGGRVVYQGPLSGLLRAKGSPTAPYLRAKAAPAVRRPARKGSRPGSPRP